MNPKTIKEIEQKTYINILDIISADICLVNILEEIRILSLSLLDNVEKQIEKQLIGREDYTRTAHKTIINILSDLREGK